MTSLLRLLATISLMATLPAASQAQSRPRLTGTYSSMSLHAETGDLAGVEMAVYFSREGFHVVVQLAEGSPDAPLLLPLEVRDSTIRFAFPAESKYASGLKTFSGLVTEAGITGTFANGYRVQLRRLMCK
jgi:hypothetical protein